MSLSTFVWGDLGFCTVLYCCIDQEIKRLKGEKNDKGEVEQGGKCA